MSIKGAALFKKLKINDVKDNLDMDFLFHIGGPLNQNNGFILHSQDYKSQHTLKVTKDVNLTCSTEIITDIAKNKGPKNTLFHLVILVGDLDSLKMKSNRIVGLISEELDLLFDVDSEKMEKCS